MHRNVLFLAILALGCGDKKSDAPKSEPPKASPPMPAPALETEPRTLDLPGFTAKGDVPKGWQESKVGPNSVLFMRPHGMAGSTFWIAQTCHGDCATIAENLKGAAAAQAKTHEAQDYQVRVVADAAIEGGREFELDATKGPETIRQYVVTRWQPEWKEAVSCSLTVMADELQQFDALKELCRKLSVTPK